MQAILLLVVGKIIDAIIFAIGKWIAAQQVAHKKVSDYHETKKEAIKKAQEYEKNPTADNRDDVP